MRRLTLGLTVLGLALGLASCKSTQPEQDPTPEATMVTITFIEHESTREAYEALMAEFHARHPDVEVQFVPLEESLGDARFDVQALASAADTTVLGRSPSDANAADLRDLTPLIEADPTVDRDDFWPGLLDGCRAGEQMTGLPVALGINLVYFDGAAFDAAGLARPAPGWTWDDFEVAARSLTRRDGERTTRYGFVPWGSAIELLGPLADAALAETGGELDPAVLAPALDWYVGLAREGASPVWELDPDRWRKNRSLVEGGQATMWVDLSANLASRRLSTGGEIGIAPFPVSASAPHTTPITPFCATMSADTTHPQQAWAWLNFLSAHPIEGRLPVRPSMADAGGYWDVMSAETQAVLRFALAHAWYGSRHPEALSEVAWALSEALAGETSLTSALRQRSALPPTATPH